MTFFSIFSIACIVALLARRTRVPYTVALVLAGLLLGNLHAIDAPRLTQDLLYSVFLPGLIFEAAFQLKFKDFLANKIAIHSLAIPGVIASIGLSSALLIAFNDQFHPFGTFNWVTAALFAALVSATDPIAVVSMLRTLGVPKRLAILIEGESLLNDGTAIAIFGIVLAMASGADFTSLEIVTKFFLIAGLGALIGVTFGFTIGQVIRKVDDSLIEITLTVIAAYGSFAVAEYFHFSGVIATVASGMVVGNYAKETGMSTRTKIAVDGFWEYLAFAFNSAVFLLIGFEVDLHALFLSLPYVAMLYVGMMLVRYLVVVGTQVALRKSKEAFSSKWSAALTWGGLRGSLSMVLVLSLPIDFPDRQTYINLTYGIVLFSILTQGLTMNTLLKRLGLTKQVDPEHHAYSELKAKIRLCQISLSEVEKLRSQNPELSDILDTFKTHYLHSSAELNTSLKSLHITKDELRSTETEFVKNHLGELQTHYLEEARSSGLLTEPAFRKLYDELTAKT